MGGGNNTTSSSSSSYPAQAPRPVGQWITGLYKDRLHQFTDRGQYEKQNLLSMTNEAVASGHPHVKLYVWNAPGTDRPSFEEATSHKFEETSIGKSFGPGWSTHWFKVELTVPEDMRKKEHLEFHWDANNEGMIWSEDGNPLQGLTGGGERVEWIFPKSFRDGKTHIFYVEMACNGMFGIGAGNLIQPPDPNKTFRLSKADIVAVNLEARALHIDYWIIGDVARELPSETPAQHKALEVCTRIMNTFVPGSQESILECRKIARECLGSDVDSHKVYRNKEPIDVYGIGHCHIDSCWLWPWDETKRKVARSWSNQCNLMERYPELNFACSQAQQYKWLKEIYPYVFDRVKTKVREGQFHPIGGSWVEHDTNMPSGESLARQFLYGQRFFESNFGQRCKTFWLPDTFGYSSQLPQLCRLAGMDRFLTQKLSWNNINKFPHTTFSWVALDGSQVVCHMPPSETYTAAGHFGDVRRSMIHHKSLGQDSTSLLVFGKGDGGGGPTWEHIEKLRRCRALTDNMHLGKTELPRVHMGNSVDDFFDKIMPHADKLVTWYGELYFELHRGTYTTQANNKLYNRKGEHMLRDVELLATRASLEDKKYKYPKADIDEMWEAVLLCQFHDCLPGSSIEMCYDDSDKMYERVFHLGHRIIKDCLKILVGSAAKGTCSNASVAMNTLPWPRNEIVELDDGVGLAKGSGMMLPVHAVDAKSMPKVTVEEARKGVFVLQNDHLRVTVEKGVITSLYDRVHEREVIEKGQKANQFSVYDDKPLYWQAWDVEVYHLDTGKVLPSGDTEISEDKPHRCSLVTKVKISDKSHLTSTISLGAVLEGASSYVECNAEVEWHETMKFLKVEFPVEVRNTEASYETAFGITRRPTHYNTTWDMAKFEVCCHRWADLSESTYGVSILNDSKYGFSTCGNLMRLSLLRSPKAPDAHADMGRHKIRWALFPHEGNLGSKTVRAGFEFNSPMRTVSVAADLEAIAGGERGCSPVTLDGDSSLVLDTVKRGEDDEDVSRGELPKRRGRSVVLRIYDSLGGRARGTVHCRQWEVKKVFKSNILEDDIEEMEHKDGKFNIELRPFEVATYRLEL